MLHGDAACPFCRPTCHPQQPTKIYTFALRYAFNMREQIVGHGLVGWLAGWLAIQLGFVLEMLEKLKNTSSSLSAKWE